MQEGEHVRVLIYVDDNDRSFITESKQVAGEVIMFHAPGRAIRATVVGQAEPVNAVGTTHTFRAIYDITPLDEMK